MVALLVTTLALAAINTFVEEYLKYLAYVEDVADVAEVAESALVALP
jgi:hypothetical protein